MNELTLDGLGLAAEQSSTVSSDHARLVAATFDEDGVDPGDLPIPWHWAFFTEAAPTSRLGADGHPARHGDLAARFPRRMWAGGEVVRHGPLVADRPATKRTELASQAVKSGSTGELLVVAVQHTVEQDGRVVLTERQDVVYRGAGSPTAPPGPAVDAAAGASWHEVHLPTPALLLRYSALTFNAHRIHYDAAYATEVEGYPGLVVHGPLTATLLARAARRLGGRAVTSLAFRAMAPLFVGQPITITGELDERAGSAELAAVRVDGVVAMTARCGLA